VSEEHVDLFQDSEFGSKTRGLESGAPAEELRGGKGKARGSLDTGFPCKKAPL
jgi:hypothetical protein